MHKLQGDREAARWMIVQSLSLALEPDRERIPLQRFGFEAVPEEALQAIAYRRIHRSWSLGLLPLDGAHRSGSG